MSASRVIEVSFGNETVVYVNIDTAYYYNDGVIIKPTDGDLPDTYQVHWADSPEAQTTLETIGTPEGVPVPDELWGRSKVIYGWFYLHPTEDSSVTYKEIRIYKSARAGLPDGTEPTPSEHSTIDQLISAMNTAADKAEQNADSASSDADRAETARNEAETYAVNAQTSASNAEASATTATTKAQIATASATTATTAAQTATAKATEASNSASSAAESASSASDSADSASRSEQAAKISETNAADSESNASTYANSARGYAQTAQSASASASSSATSASNSATSASNSATSASQSAGIATEAKADIEGMVDDAQGYAESASQSASASAQSASASANSASDAQGYANSASASAQSASGYASSAQTSAQTASSKATEANTSAQTASQKATEAAQSASQALSYKTDAEQAKTASQTAQGLAESARDSAVQAKTDAESAKADAESARDEAQQAVASISGALAEKAPVITDTASGAIASFTDGADDLPLKSLVVDINPVQDLHGQDAPYPAGGGKNLASDIVSDYTKPTNYWVWHRTLEDGTYYITVTPKSGAETGYVFIIAKTGDAYAEFVDTVTVLTTAGATYNRSFTVDSTWTNPVIGIYCPNGKTVSDFFANYTVQLEKNATATAYAPYENICPISGWTSVGVNQFAVNVWDEEWEVGAYTLDGTKTTATDRIRCKNHIPVIGGSSLYFKAPSGTAFYIMYDSDGSPLSVSIVSFNTNSVINVPNNASYMLFYMSAAYGTTYNHDISINYPSSDHSYHPYTGRSITIQLGQTVYGGKLDVLSGELVVDRAMFTLDSSLNMDKYIYKDMNGVMCQNALSGKQTRLKGISSHSGLVGNYFTSNSIWLGVNDGNIFWIGILDILGMSTISEFKAWLDTQSVQFCYELAEPIEIQLSANQLNSLYGVNNLWADSGDTEVEYRANTELWVQRKITEAVAAVLNS